MRKILFAALLCTSALALSTAANARTLTTTPDSDGAMLIPTHTSTAAQVIPVQYRHRHYRHWHHRHYRHYR